MAQFSDDEIRDAKRRVEEMRSRASRFVNDEQDKPFTQEREDTVQGKDELRQEESKQDEESKDSSLIILAIIFLLQKEGADNLLLFVLLYLLL